MSIDNEKNQRTRNNFKKVYPERKKERKRNGLPYPRHKTMNYEDKERPIEHSGEKNKEKLTISETRHQKKKERETYTHKEKRYRRKGERERSKISLHFNVIFFFFCLPRSYRTLQKEFFSKTLQKNFFGTHHHMNNSRLIVPKL